MAAQLKVHINTTTVTKYDNNKYDKPEKLKQMKKKNMSSNCRDNHMKCMQRDLDWDMYSRCKQVEDILDFYWFFR